MEGGIASEEGLLNGRREADSQERRMFWLLLISDGRMLLSSAEQTTDM